MEMACTTANADPPGVCTKCGELPGLHLGVGGSRSMDGLSEAMTASGLRDGDQEETAATERKRHTDTIVHEPECKYTYGRDADHASTISCTTLPSCKGTELND